MNAVHWVVHGGARDALEYQVREERSHKVNCRATDCNNWMSQVLGDELQQLGMPKEHAGAIARFPPNCLITSDTQ